MSTSIVQNSNVAEPFEARVHLGWLDSLRALAALYVVMNHVISIVNRNTAHYHGIFLFVAGPFRYGHSAVGLFIVLSGFSLMIPVTRNGGQLRGSAWTFFFRRAKRILPPYYGALALSLLLIHFLIGQETGSVWDMAIPVTRFNVWTHIFLLQDVYTDPKINFPLWSISVEWRIYFLFPIFVLLFRRWGGLTITLMVLVVAFLTLLGFQHSVLKMLCGIMPAYYALFVMGMLACEIAFGHRKQVNELRERMPWLILTCPLSLFYLALLFYWRGNSSQLHLFIQDAIDGILSSMLLIMLSKRGKNRLRECLSWKPIMSIGTFAYSIYLIHAPVAQVIWQYGLHPLHLSVLVTYVLMVFIALPLVVGAAYLFFLVFERPFLNTKKHESMKETAQDAALSPAP